MWGSCPNSVRKPYNQTILTLFKFRCGKTFWWVWIWHLFDKLCVSYYLFNLFLCELTLNVFSNWFKWIVKPNIDSILRTAAIFLTLQLHSLDFGHLGEVQKAVNTTLTSSKLLWLLTYILSSLSATLEFIWCHVCFHLLERFNQREFRLVLTSILSYLITSGQL